MIIQDRGQYKLDIDVKLIATGEMLMTIKRWMPETGWAKMEMYFTDEEYEELAEYIDQFRAGNVRIHR